MSDNNEYLSEILFHFWNHRSFERAFGTFVSIIEKGLLLTRGNRELIDRFHYLRKDGKLDFVECVQNARICFTDIPEDKVSKHCTRYGRCAVGFSRKTILEWGGCPVWYLPNHFKEKTLQDHSGALAYGLADAIELLGLIPSILKTTNTTLTSNSAAMTPKVADERIEFARQSVLRLLSFLKSMSSRQSDDHCYLYEREWRIVSGLRSDHYDECTRKLTADEKKWFLSVNPDWGRPIESTERAITAQFCGDPLINSFHIFDGIPGQDKISKKLEKILCPDEKFERCVREFIASHPEHFKIGGPEVEIIT